MKRKIGFFGGDGQTGTSVVSLSFGILLAERGKKVLYISGSGNCGDCFFRSETGGSLDDLKAAVRSGSVQKEELMQFLDQKGNLWVLPGVRNPLTVSRFPENTYETLLKSVEDEFDYMVIDGGSDLRRALTVSALNYCEDRYFVITQQAKTVGRFVQWQKQVLRPLMIPVNLIVNRYRKDPALLLKGDIAKVTDAEEIWVIPDMGNCWQAEMEKKTLLAFPTFAKTMKKIISTYEPVAEGRGNGKGVFFRCLSAE